MHAQNHSQKVESFAKVFVTVQDKLSKCSDIRELKFVIKWFNQTHSSFIRWIEENVAANTQFCSAFVREIDCLDQLVKETEILATEAIKYQITVLN